MPVSNEGKHGSSIEHKQSTEEGEFLFHSIQHTDTFFSTIYGNFMDSSKILSAAFVL